MCGIIGIVSQQEDVVARLLEGLKRLEYRGYDSMGMATLSQGKLQCQRVLGKWANLEKRLSQQPLQGTTGIGHTRWATHGVPAERNAHPHSNRRVAVVHNGIIENFQVFKDQLQQQGVVFESETDTEVVVHLFTQVLDAGKTPLEAAALIFPQLEGAFALALLFDDAPDFMIVGRRGQSPLAVGYGKEAMVAGSDGVALAGLADKMSYLEDGDWAVLSPTSITLYNLQGQTITRPLVDNPIHLESISKQNHAHFMHKEIEEQPEALEKTYRSFVSPEKTFQFPFFPWNVAHLPKITLVACGTAYFAGVIGKYWLEKWARLPCEVDIASEFRYRKPPLPEDGLALFISQSGETVDTLGALDYAASQHQHLLAIVNVLGSSLDRAADVSLHTQAGPEVGVASTKAFTTQLMILALFSLAVAQARQTLEASQVKQHLLDLEEAPQRVQQVLALEDQIKALASSLIGAQDALYLGRGIAYPLALEGALKLKEVSYIHAEGYAAGEMKHGPIALIDTNVPVIVVAPHDEYFEKTASNIQEVAARKGRLIILTDAVGFEKLKNVEGEKLLLPESTSFTAPLFYSVPLQFLAYHVALAKGTNVDQPRNLAKSVTVE